MSVLQLKNLFCIKQCKIIAVLATNHYYPVYLKYHGLKDSSFPKVSTHGFTSYRNFTYAGFYTAIAESTPVLCLQNVLLDIHQSSGLPWWSVIMLTTFGLRTLVMFPLSVHQNQVIARLANINAEIAKLAPELNKEVNIAKTLYKFDEIGAKKIFRKQLREIHNNLVLRDNCHPSKTVILALIQMPVWVCFSMSLRNLTFTSMYFSSVPESLNQLKSEGLLWFPDLTCPDPIFIPLLFLVVNLSLTEVHALRQVGKGTLLQKILLNSSRIVIVIVAAAATVNPSSVTFYWVCSSTFGLVQNLLLMSPKFRRILRIPATAKESSTPFKDIATNFKRRFNK